MKLHAALCLALCFLGTLHLAHSFRGGETFSLFYNADEYAAAGRPTEMIGLVNFFLKKAVPDKTVRRALLTDLSYYDAGQMSAKKWLATNAAVGLYGVGPNTPASVKEMVAIFEHHIPNQELRNKMYSSIAKINLGDIKAKEMTNVVYMLNELS